MPNNPLVERSDATLVVAVARRDEGALAELYRRHSGALRTAALRVLRDPALAADVVQEVFVRLWQHPERFDAERGSLRSFLLADSHGRSVDLVRAETARRRREERELGMRLAAHEPTAEDEAVANIDAEEIRRALATLSPEERAAIDLAYFGGRSYREVALELGEPEGTVKSRIRSGLVKLRGAVTVEAIA